MQCGYELCYILIISIFNFLIFIHFTNQITLKPSLAQKLKLMFKFSTIMGQMNVPLWTHNAHKGWRRDGKTFIRCYTIALKFWDELNANFVLLYLFYLPNTGKLCENTNIPKIWILTCSALLYFAWNRNPCNSDNMGKLNSHSKGNVWENTNIPKLRVSYIFHVRH